MTTGGEASDFASTQNPSGTQNNSVITIPVNIPLPEKLYLIGGNLPVKWQQFSRAWSNYETRKIRIGTRNEGPPRYLRALARTR